MTVLDTLAELDRIIALWQRDEIAALRDGDADAAHDARIRVEALRYVRVRLVETADELLNTTTIRRALDLPDDAGTATVDG